MSRSPPTFTFGDESPPSSVRSGRKHRRGRGYAPSSRISAANNAPAAKDRNASVAPSKSASYHQSGGRNSPQSPSQANYAFSTGDAWNASPARKGNVSNNNNNNVDDGSLAYSASSSVQSAESSNDSSFVEIFKVIGNEEEGNSEIKDFIARQSKAANAHNGSGEIVRGAGTNNAALLGRNQRNQSQQPLKKKKQQQKYNAGGSRQQHSNQVDWNYSKDSSDDDMFGFNDYEENVLENLDTIVGKREKDNIVAHRITITSQATNSNAPKHDPIFSADPFASNNSQYDSPSSSPNSDPWAASPAHVTPPPDSRRKRSSTPPSSADSYRHSKSSSDESWDTPTASSPPHSAEGGRSSKPPHARGTHAGSKTRRKRGKERAATEDSLSKAFYTKPWMCGFTDAFNFDDFDMTFQK